MPQQIPLIRLSATNVHVFVGSNIVSFKTKFQEHSSHTDEGTHIIGIGENGKEFVVTASISSCRQFIATCSNEKVLTIWKTDGWTVVSRRIIQKIARKLCFTPSGSGIVLADKTGDVYLFSVAKPNEDGKLLLGHFSMVLDVLISVDEKFIITCDRDEKIRVSHFPNAYNIYGFCLGHKEFVGNLSLLPHDEKVLISSSGDGTIRLWDFERVAELYCVNTKCNFENEEDVEHVSQDDIALPVTHLSTCKIDTNSSLLCMSVQQCKACKVYEIRGNSKELKSVLIQNLHIDFDLWDMRLSGEMSLWMLGTSDNDHLRIYNYNKDLSQFVSNISNINESVVNIINAHCSSVQAPSLHNMSSVLYKRKVDTVNEYLNRKKQRLASKQCQ